MVIQKHLYKENQIFEGFAKFNFNPRSS